MTDKRDPGPPPASVFPSPPSAMPPFVPRPCPVCRRVLWQGAGHAYEVGMCSERGSDECREYRDAHRPGARPDAAMLDHQYDEYMSMMEKEFWRMFCPESLRVPAKYFCGIDLASGPDKTVVTVEGESYGPSLLQHWPWGLDVGLLRQHYDSRWMGAINKRMIAEWRKAHPGRDYLLYYSHVENRPLRLMWIADNGPAVPEDNVEMGE